MDPEFDVTAPPNLVGLVHRVVTAGPSTCCFDDSVVYRLEASWLRTLTCHYAN